MTPAESAAARRAPEPDIVDAEPVTDPTQVPPPASDDRDRMQEQMLAFARDLNRIYHEERSRALELEGALSELEEAYSATVRTLAFVVEARDPNTRAHLDRAYRYALALCRKVAPELAKDQSLRYGFMLHDIGKVGIPEGILGKPGPLTDQEWEVIRTHPIIGGQILGPIKAFANAIPVVEGHHERWDGKGYPRGLKGENIALGARIFSIVDTYDAMTSDRPYRKALSVERSLEEIETAAGRQFDPEIALQFVRMIEDGGPLDTGDDGDAPPPGLG